MLDDKRGAESGVRIARTGARLECQPRQAEDQAVVPPPEPRSVNPPDRSSKGLVICEVTVMLSSVSSDSKSELHLTPSFLIR